MSLATHCRPGDRQAARELAAMGLATVPVEAAIDGEGRLRRVVFTLDLAAVSGEQAQDQPGAQPVNFSIELFDFGAELDVDAPPEAEVINASELGAQPAAVAPGDVAVDVAVPC